MVHGLETLKKLNENVKKEGKEDPRTRSLLSRASEAANNNPWYARQLINAPWDNAKCNAEQKKLYGKE
ncbi:hypothetical protein JXA56_04980 [Candidatus Micrarchaeota archaeon]|nr:hypothetical protein [Candidatus Micrarchaeota archaeon]